MVSVSVLGAFYMRCKENCRDLTALFHSIFPHFEYHYKDIAVFNGFVHFMKEQSAYTHA
jgi:hypothetical protein